MPCPFSNGHTSFFCHIRNINIHCAESSGLCEQEPDRYGDDLRKQVTGWLQNERKSLYRAFFPILGKSVHMLKND